MTDADDLSPQELLLESKAKYEMSWDELGSAMGRSPRMMRKIARGETSGASYREALVELYTRGEIRHIPSRRRNKAGNLVNVRAKRGAETKSVAPHDDGGRYVRSPKRGRFTVAEDEQIEAGDENYTRADGKEPDVFFPEGGRMSTVEMPKSKGKGRISGWDAIKSKLRSAAKSQRGHDKRVRFEVEFDVGDGRRRVVTIGEKSGYAASDALSDINKIHGGDAEAFINDQAQQRYQGDLQPGKNAVPVKIRMSTFDATRSKDERKAQDAAGVRRWNRDSRGQKLSTNPLRRHRRDRNA
jgi:hypothetical protein